MSFHAPVQPLGLTDEEAARRRAALGANRIETVKSRSLIQVALSALREPMFLLLLGATALYLLLGDLAEGLFLLAGAGAAIGLVIFQQVRSERALAALRQLAEPTARALRSGIERRLPASELVPDDVVLVGEGERLAADSELVFGDALEVDESALTGESAPVTKSPAGGEAAQLFAGTMLVRGQGVARVLRTGASTRIGAIGKSLGALQEQPTRLQQASASLVGRLGVAAIGFCAIVVVAYGLLRGDWVGGALAGITVGIALIPEEFPMVLAIFLALGAWRLARHKVLVRRPAVIEALGAISVLAVDKTGTLTENRMRVVAVWRDGRLWETEHGALQGQDLAHVVEVAALASAVRPADPMDRAVRDMAAGAGVPVSQTPPLRSYPLRPDRLAFIQVWPQPSAGVLLAAKGAPEAICSLCRLSPEATEAVEATVSELAASGLRVLGVAALKRAVDGGEDPGDLAFAFEGLVGFEDPVRPDVPAALAEARRAGIAVAMITGDYPATALHIAREAGIDATAGVLTGAEIQGLSDEALAERVAAVRVFARVSPEQKLRLVEAFKARGQLVAMTGDGVNDAPALESAHVGVAMGLRGTDVAREASDLILLDDRFASIVGGVRLGRRISVNLRKALTYIVAVHVPIAGLALLPILMGLPPVLYPMQVVVLELIIDPVCSLVFEAEPSEARAMQRPPPPPSEPLFGVAQVALGVVQGAVVLAGVLGFYAAMLGDSVPAEAARAFGFAALVSANLGLAIGISAAKGVRAFDPRHAIFWMIALTAAAAVWTAVYAAPVANLFGFAAVDPARLAAVMAIAALLGGGVGSLRRWWLTSVKAHAPAVPYR